MTSRRGPRQQPDHRGIPAALPCLHLRRLPVLLLALVLALAGCGGGSGGATTPEGAPPDTGGGSGGSGGGAGDPGGGSDPGSGSGGGDSGGGGGGGNVTSPENPIPPLPAVATELLLRYLPTGPGGCPDEDSRLPATSPYAALRLQVTDMASPPVVRLTVSGESQVADIGEDNVCGSHQGIVTFPVNDPAASAGGVDITWADGTATTHDVPLGTLVTLRQPTLGLAQSADITPAQLDDAIARAIAWFNSIDPASIKPDAFIILRRLQLVYGLADLNLPGDPADGPDLSAPGLQEFTRIHDTGQTWSGSTAELGVLDSATLPALYCRDYPLPAGYRDQLMTQMAEEGGYLASHALLAYALVKDNGCDTAFLSDDDVARLLLINLALVDYPIDYFSFADGLPGIQDLRIEIMALLAAIGRQDLVPPALFSDLLTRQLGNGGWAFYVEGNAANSHTTALALWLLLQARDFNRNFTPFVARATP